MLGRFSFCAALAAVALALWTPPTVAFPTYSRATTGEGYCKGCHGPFPGDEYISPSDGRNWGNLHNLHRNVMLAGGSFPDRCFTCHLTYRTTSSGTRIPTAPVYTFQSLGNGTAGWAPISCVGCHGRAEDSQDGSARGMGAGLRQHHWNAGIRFCANCHGDANPANFTTVGENVAPPYYFQPDAVYASKPTNACNNNGEEDFAGLLYGLDNDGDGKYDVNDPDCKPAFGKVVVCHVPQGAGAAPQTMSINVNALFSHAAHGDLLGACPE